MSGVLASTLRALLPLATAIACSITLLAPAHALTSAEARLVVKLIWKLQQSLGPFAYDAEVADAWFDEDEAGDRYISAAGFDRASWKRAVDDTVRGYFAAMPQNEFEAPLAGLEQKYASREDFSDAQKAAIREMVAEQTALMRQLRAEGAAHAEAVRPHAALMRTILQNGTEGQ